MLTTTIRARLLAGLFLSTTFGLWLVSGLLQFSRTEAGGWLPFGDGVLSRFESIRAVDRAAGVVFLVGGVVGCIWLVLMMRSRARRAEFGEAVSRALRRGPVAVEWFFVVWVGLRVVGLVLETSFVGDGVGAGLYERWAWLWSLLALLDDLAGFGVGLMVLAPWWSPLARRAVARGRHVWRRWVDSTP